jgi:hypothetical protein
MFALVIVAWSLIAAGVVRCSLALVAALNFLAGAASANFNLANVRITMATMPEMGRNHFFALFTMITSLGLGGAPVAWGLVLDAVGSYEAVTGVFHWKRHSIYSCSVRARCNRVRLHSRLYEAGHQCRRRLASLAYTPSSARSGPEFSEPREKRREDHGFLARPRRAVTWPHFQRLLLLVLSRQFTKSKNACAPL